MNYFEMAYNQAKLCKHENDNKPHPKVGAVVVFPDGTYICGYRGQKDPGDHAEFTVFKRVGENLDFARSTLYTTLEPCTKRNPPKIPCVERIIEKKIKRVFVGMLDPNSFVCGKGVNILRKNNVEVKFFPVKEMEKIESLNSDFIRDQDNKSKVIVPSRITFPAFLTDALCTEQEITFISSGGQSIRDFLYSLDTQDILQKNSKKIFKVYLRGRKNAAQGEQEHYLQILTEIENKAASLNIKVSFFELEWDFFMLGAIITTSKAAINFYLRSTEATRLWREYIVIDRQGKADEAFVTLLRNWEMVVKKYYKPLNLSRKGPGK